jgi:PAS domain S-box-containing protein
MSALHEFFVLIVRPISRSLLNTTGVMAWVLLWAMLPPVPARALPSDSSLVLPKRVRSLHQAGDAGALRGEFNIAFDEAIRSANPHPAEIDEETIDSQRLHGANQARLTSEYLQLKYVGRSLGVNVGMVLSFFAQNGRYAAGALLLVLAQFALIVALLVQRFRRRAAEEESRQSNERYRSVVDTQSELICRFLPDTTLTFVNDAYCRFRNATRGELLGTKLLTQIPEPARETVLKRLHQLNGLDSYEHPVILPGGSVGWHFWANQAIRDDRGRIVEFQGIGRDITEQKRAQEALSQAEARNSAMLRAIPDLMFVMLRDGTYVDYHARDPKLLFVPPSVFIGKKVRDIMPPRLADVMMDAIEGACQREETVAVEYDLTLDEIRYFEARVVHAGDDRVLSMVRDVTDSKRAIALNQDLTGRLIASQEIERQRIARELHDDVSQKVALLNIDIEEVARQVEGIEPRGRLQQLSMRAKEIAGDLRDLSHELHASRLQSLGLIAAVEMLCRDTSKHLGVTVPFVHGTLPSDVDPNVSLCVYRIAQEALTNVARHSQARHAQVMLFYESPMLMLQIADSGVGFDPRTTRHAGLGLISMRDRVAFLRGQLAIHTEPGGGTRIGVNIPIGSVTEASSAGISRSA